jgi:hypothetical protein
VSEQLNRDYEKFEAEVAARKCQHCGGAGTIWTEEMDAERERLSKLAKKEALQADRKREREAKSKKTDEELAEEEKAFWAGMTTTERMKNFALYLNVNRGLWSAIRKEFGYSFVATLTDEGDGIVLKVTEQDNGAERMTLRQTAKELNLSPTQLKTRCYGRFREQQLKNGQTPLSDLIHGIGRDKYFLRGEILKYKQGPTVEAITREVAAGVASLRGKKARKK